MSISFTNYKSRISVLFLGVIIVAGYALLTSMHPKIYDYRVKGKVTAVAGDVTTARVRCELVEGSPFSMPPHYLDVKADGSFQGILNVPENAIVNFTVEKPGYSADNHSQELVGEGEINKLRKDFTITSLTSDLNTRNNSLSLVAFDGSSIQNYRLISLRDVQYFRNITRRNPADLNGGDHLPPDHIVLSADLELKEDRRTLPVIFTLKKHGERDAYLTSLDEYPWLKSTLSDNASSTVRRVSNKQNH